MAGLRPTERSGSRVANGRMSRKGHHR